jgi:hypothetical protein
MMNFNFIASNRLELDDFKDIEKFVDSYPDFQTVFLKDEIELNLLLQLIGIEKIIPQELNELEFSKYWDLSKFKFPEFNEEQFDQFYKKWLHKSCRDNNMDEYGNLIFLQGLSKQWNQMKHRSIVKEN